MYPLPPELSEKIFGILNDKKFVTQEERHDLIAALFVRENRRMRQQILELWRDFRDASDRHDGDYGAIMSASGGEFTCQHIIDNFIKPNVYFNSKETEERIQAVEDFIEDLDQEDDTLFPD